MNNKKLFASALALSMFFGLTACSSEKPEDTKVVEKKEEKKELPLALQEPEPQKDDDFGDFDDSDESDSASSSSEESES